MTKMYMRGGVYYGTAEDMIDRIEELEAKLTKATAALERCSDYSWARDALAELKGEDRG